MIRYFSGEGTALGTVTALAQTSFAQLCELLSQPVRLPLTRPAYHALDHAAQGRAKRVRYITPCTFAASPSDRLTALAVRCNLLALDIDAGDEARRLLSQRWEDCLGDLGFIVWHTATSTPAAPRLRILVHAEGIQPSRYGAAVRTVAEMIGLAHLTTESRVVVQPMYFPTTFQGEEGNPVVASNTQGDPFLPSDILGDEDFGDHLEPSAPVDGVADLQFLRSPLEGVTLADAEGALTHLDPDLPMQQWIELAAALKHQFDSEEAFQLWDRWSAKGKKYPDSSETRYRWNSLKGQTPDRAPVTIRSLFRQAQARGWSNPSLARRQHSETLQWLKSSARSAEELLDQGARRIAKVAPVLGQLERKTLLVALRDVLATRDVPLPLPDIKKEVRQLELDAARTTGLPPWAKGICYVTSLNLFYRHTTDRRFAPEVVDLMYAAPAVGEDKPQRPRDYLMQVANVPQVENLRYDPAQGGNRFFKEDGVPYVNTYRGNHAAPDLERAQEAGGIFREHIANLVTEEAYQRTLIDFLAYHVQKPGRKIRWALLLQSAQGAGKTFLAVAMAAVLGRRNVNKVSASNIMDGQHNNWAYGSQLVVIEEIRIVGHNRYSVMDKLKPCISDDDISLHCKFENVRTVPNVSNYVMFTNHHDALAIHDDDRRYFVLASPLQRPDQVRRLGGEAYFDRLFGMVRDNAGGLRAWLEQWPLSKDFTPEGRAPSTPYLRDLAENAASPLAAAVRLALEDRGHPLVAADLVSLPCLRSVIDSSHLPDYSDQALAGVLRELGWAKSLRVALAGGKHQLWTKGDLADPRAEALRRLACHELI